MPTFDRIQNLEALRSYRFRFFSMEGTLHAALMLCLNSDATAYELAADLIGRSACHLVLVYREDQFLFAVRRGEPTIVFEMPKLDAA